MINVEALGNEYEEWREYDPTVINGLPFMEFRNTSPIQAVVDGAYQVVMSFQENHPLSEEDFSVHQMNLVWFAVGYMDCWNSVTLDQMCAYYSHNAHIFTPETV